MYPGEAPTPTGAVTKIAQPFVRDAGARAPNARAEQPETAPGDIKLVAMDINVVASTRTPGRNRTTRPPRPRSTQQPPHPRPGLQTEAAARVAKFPP